MAYNKMFYWSEDDHAYITNVPSLPGCMADGETIEESLENADVIIEEWISLAKELGREIPPEDFAVIDSTAPTSIDVAAYILAQLNSESEKRHMDNVIATYGNENGDTLREYTHRERPWRETRVTLKDGESDNKDIPERLMMEYYHN